MSGCLHDLFKAKFQCISLALHPEVEKRILLMEVTKIVDGWLTVVVIVFYIQHIFIIQLRHLARECHNNWYGGNDIAQHSKLCKNKKR